MRSVIEVHPHRGEEPAELRELRLYFNPIGRMCGVKTCKDCGTKKPLTEFRHRKNHYGVMVPIARCRPCEPAYEKRLRDNTPQRERTLAYRREYHRKNGDQIRARNAAWRWERRLKVLAAYGGKCVCCGESTPEFLVLDHINGGGTAERKQLGNGNEIIAQLIREGYPETMQILCANCNMAKERPGGCPHHRITPIADKKD
jgi:hypothetical protein